MTTERIDKKKLWRKAMKTTFSTFQQSRSQLDDFDGQHHTFALKVKCVFLYIFFMKKEKPFRLKF